MAGRATYGSTELHRATISIIYHLNPFFCDAFFKWIRTSRVFRIMFESSVLFPFIYQYELAMPRQCWLVEQTKIKSWSRKHCNYYITELAFNWKIELFLWCVPRRLIEAMNSIDKIAIESPPPKGKERQMVLSMAMTRTIGIDECFVPFFAQTNMKTVCFTANWARICFVSQFCNTQCCKSVCGKNWNCLRSSGDFLKEVGSLISNFPCYPKKLGLNTRTFLCNWNGIRTRAPKRFICAKNYELIQCDLASSPWGSSSKQHAHPSYKQRKYIIIIQWCFPTTPNANSHFAEQ